MGESTRSRQDNVSFAVTGMSTSTGTVPALAAGRLPVNTSVPLRVITTLTSSVVAPTLDTSPDRCSVPVSGAVTVDGRPPRVKSRDAWKRLVSRPLTSVAAGRDVYVMSGSHA